MSNVNQLLQQAIGLHQQGRLADAEPVYRAVLNAQPDNFDGRHLLGVLRLQQGRHEEAVALIGRALRARPNAPEALANAGLALQALGRHDEAIASYDRAVALKPDFADALFNRGNALGALGRYADAVASYDRAIALRPTFAAALANRGNALQLLRRPAEAIASYDAALALRADRADVLNNRGNAYAELHRHREALADYDRALAQEHRSPDAHTNRGNALAALGYHAEALRCHDRALALASDHPAAHYNRGIALNALRRNEEAVAAYDRAIALGADAASALHNRGIALTQLERHDEAGASYDRALAIDPGSKYLPGDVAHARAHLCDWTDRDALVARIVAGVAAQQPVCAPFAFLSLTDDPAAQRACAEVFVRDTAVAPGRALWNGERYAHDRIRVAYLSADYYSHATAYLTARLFELHDRERFAIHGISFGPDDRSEMRARLSAGFDRFIDVRDRSDADVAALLRELEIDIAVDLKGYTKDSRPGILLCRPAPIQVSYLGYPGTMGAGFIDYVLGDPFVIPAADRMHYREAVVHLRGCYQVNDAMRAIAARTPTRAEAGLPEARFVYCCFNNSYKITPAVFDTWMRLLRQVDGAVLWLLAGDPAAERNLRREAGEHGIDPARLVFAPRMPLAEHLARHRLADLFVDTLPYNAHTTASDALWSGLPVLTCVGRSFASRVAGSLLHAVGLPELVTDDAAAYEALALELARDPARLADFRARLARDRLALPLFDTDGFRRQVEAAYTTMVERHRRGEPPAAFAVADAAH